MASRRSRNRRDKRQPIPDFDEPTSPACQGHSRARGKERAHHDAQRSTAWAKLSIFRVVIGRSGGAPWWLSATHPSLSGHRWRGL